MKNNPIWRNILAVVVAMVVCSIVITAVEAISHAIYPPPEGMDPNDPESIKKYFPEIPAAALAMVVLAWGMGTFCGGFLAAKLAMTRPMLLAMIVAGFYQIAGLVMLIIMPSPVGMWIGGLLVFFPSAYVGARLAGDKLAPEPPDPTA